MSLTLKRPRPRGEYAPARLANTFERTFWRPLSKRQRSRLIAAAELYERATRGPGMASGKLGTVGVEAIKLFANLAHRHHGRVYPPIARIAALLKRSVDAVCRAIRALIAAGFLEKARRFTVSGVVGKGPQIRQTANAYRVGLPETAKALLQQHEQQRAIPAPEDEEVRQIFAALTNRQYEAEHREILAASNGITAALDRLALLVAQRDSAAQGQF